MTKCKLCNKEIPYGNEYCSDCLEKSTVNETNPDNLIGSVNHVPEDELPIINIGKNDMEDVMDNHDMDEILSNVSDDIKEFENFDMDEDLKDILLNDLPVDLPEDYFTNNDRDLNDFLPDEMKDMKDKIIISDDDLFGGDIKNHVDERNDDFTTNEKIAENSENMKEEASLNEEHQYNTDISSMQIKQEDQTEIIHNNLDSDEYTETIEDDNVELSLDDLINQLEATEPYQKDIEKSKDDDQEELQDGLIPADPDQIETMEEEATVDDEFLSLLNQINEDDPVADDVKAINDLLNITEKGIKSNNSLNDVGEVFSDALKVVSSLNDPLQEEIDLDQIIDNKKKKDKKNKKEKKAGKKENNKKEDNKNEAEKVKKESFLQKIFGKSKDKKVKRVETLEELSAEDESAASDELPRQNVQAAPTPKKKKKEKVSKVKKEKKNKKVKEAKADDSASQGNREREVTNESKRKETETSGSKPNKKQNKKQNKKDNNNPENKEKPEKKVKVKKKKKEQEAIQAIDEIDENERSINRFGAVTIFFIFGILVMFLLIGTNIFSYTLSIKNANTYFDRKRYTQAYNEVYGIDIKDKDIETYDKIMTVMFVNKQLNSYNNYYTIKQYPEALDSLLKGLIRYDKYVELAKMLGIKSDLDYVRKQILSELKDIFNLSEVDAMKIIKSETQKQYSMRVYDAVIENMKKDIIK